jgi:hypothetical protein
MAENQPCNYLHVGSLATRQMDETTDLQLGVAQRLLQIVMMVMG